MDLIKSDSNAQDYFYYLRNNGYQSFINTCTRPINDHNRGTCIDHFFMTSNLFVNTAKSFHPITYHYPISFSLYMELAIDV